MNRLRPAAESCGRAVPRFVVTCILLGCVGLLLPSMAGAGDPPLRQALARDLGGWDVAWRDAGGGTLLARGPALAEVGAAVLAERFLARQAGALGLSPEDLRATGSRRAGGVEHLFYQQTYEGIPVEGSRLVFSFGRGGSLVAARLATELSPAGMTPAIGIETARGLATVGLEAARETVWLEERLVVLPARFSGRSEDRLAWRLRWRTEAPVGAWRALIDAVTGEELERVSLLVSGLVLEGRIDVEMHALSPFGPEVSAGAAWLGVGALVGGAPVSMTATDAQGAFRFDDLPVGELSEVILAAALAGPYATVLENPSAPGVPQLFAPVSASPAELRWSSAEAGDAARTAYVHTLAAHERLKEIDPAFTDLDRPVLVMADDTSQVCNAWAHLVPEQPRMTFLAAGGPCPNTAEIADVVFHEYSHLISMYAYLPEWTPANLSEAFSDFYAAALVDSCLIGRDFFGAGTELRNLDHDLTWPREECEGESHCEGEVVGGALWHMREALIASEGARGAGLADTLFHFMRLGRPMDPHECLVHLLLQDDDDGDPANGTPHLDEIAGAFARHTLGDFDVRLTHAALHDVEDPEQAQRVQVTLGSIYPILPDSVRLHVRVAGGSFSSEAMTGGGWLYERAIPAQPMGTRVDYYLTAVDASGRRAILPAGAPAEPFSYYVGTDTVPPIVLHTPPTHPAVDPGRLWLVVDVTDNIGSVDEVRVDGTLQTAGGSSPWSALLVPKDPLLVPGRYETRVDLGALMAGDEVRYHLVATDGSSQANEARWPDVQEAALEVRRGRAWDFEESLEAFALSGDWAWGVTQFDPAPAPSGARLVGTVLDGLHNAQLASDLTTPEIDLTAWSCARLEFDAWFDTEDEYDGGTLCASRDGGETWEPLVPKGGYPSWIYDNEGGSGQPLPAFAGEDRVWRAVEVPLDAFVGGPVQIRFHYWSDEAIVKAGWYLDDVKVIEAQALVPPTHLAASTGEDGRVTLTWSAPPGVNTAAEEFLGYRVLRSRIGSGEALELADEGTTEGWLDEEVVNGQRYSYTVTARYASGESAASDAAEGYPYRVALAATEALEVDFDGEISLSDTLFVTNAGTGDLALELHLGYWEDDLHALIPSLAVDGEEDDAFAVLAEDGEDAAAPDLAALLARETAGELVLRLALHDSLPDPTSEATIVIYLDTDMSLATGMPMGDIGADYMAAMGAQVYMQTGALGYLLRLVDAQTVYPVAPLMHLSLEAGSDTVEVGVPWVFLGGPEEVGFAAMAMGALPIAPDQMPDPRDIGWLSLAGRTATATPDDPAALPLDYDFADHETGDYSARLFLVSNDPDESVHEVEITAHLWYLPLEELSVWSVTCLEEGLLLEWCPSAPDSFTAFLLARWCEGEDEEEAVCLGGVMHAGADSLYRYLDRTVESGRRYAYRLSGIRAAGDTLALSPAAFPLYDPPVAARLALDLARPNPFRSSTAFRIHAPEGAAWDLQLVDATGRLVRRLVRRDAGGAGVSLVAWDGRRDDGTPASGGVYYAVLRAGEKRATRSIVLVR